MKKLLILLAPIIVLGCASTSPSVEKVVYVPSPLYLPNAPRLPTWKSSDMLCLPDEMKLKILERDRARKEYIGELETIIKSTQK